MQLDIDTQFIHINVYVCICTLGYDKQESLTDHL